MTTAVLTIAGLWNSAFAKAWGARAVEVGAFGHLNSASKLGMWPEGQKLLRELLSAAGS